MPLRDSGSQVQCSSGCSVAITRPSPHTAVCPGDTVAGAVSTAQSQAALIVADLQAQGVTLAPDAELTALIAYLQRLGRGPQPTSAGGN